MFKVWVLSRAALPGAMVVSKTPLRRMAIVEIARSKFPAAAGCRLPIGQNPVNSRGSGAVRPCFQGVAT